MSKHHVKVNHWYDGILTTIHHEFESLEKALGFASDKHEAHVKIYDADQNLVHSAQIPVPPSNTYA